jgi:hypothetical protein
MITRTSADVVDIIVVGAGGGGGGSFTGGGGGGGTVLVSTATRITSEDRPFVYGDIIEFWPKEHDDYDEAQFMYVGDAENLSREAVDPINAVCVKSAGNWTEGDTVYKNRGLFRRVEGE